MRISLITEPKDGLPCTVCGSAGPVAIIHIITPSGSGTSDPLCGLCFRSEENQIPVDIEEVEVEVAGKRKALKAQRKLSQRQELDIAEELGGRVQLASGALAGSKGDVRIKGAYRIEAKFTKAGSYSLKLEDLYKIMSECGAGEKPLFIIDFLDPTGRTRDRFAVLHWEDLKEMTDAAREPS